MYNLNRGEFMSFYINYVRLCNEIGLSPSAAAEKAGIKKSNVTHWSNGGGVRESTIQRLCDTYGWKREQLLTSNPFVTSGKDTDIYIDKIQHRISKDQEELNDIYMELNETAQKLLLEISRILMQSDSNLKK